MVGKNGKHFLSDGPVSGQRQQWWSIGEDFPGRRKDTFPPSPLVCWRGVGAINGNVTIGANRVLFIGAFRRPDSLTSGVGGFPCCVLEQLSWSGVTHWNGQLSGRMT